MLASNRVGGQSAEAAVERRESAGVDSTRREHRWRLAQDARPAIVVLLPGLDGTAKLFKRFIAAAPPQIACTPVELPARPLSYEQIADEIAAHVPDGPFLLLAESFSGPLAVAVAERVRVSAFVFCNSFVRAPRSRALRWIALPVLFKLPPPRLLLRRYMLGATADEELVREVTDVVGSVPADILASGVRMGLAVDRETAFARSAVPALNIRGTEDRVVPESACRRMAALRPMSIARVPGPTCCCRRIRALRGGPLWSSSIRCQRSKEGLHGCDHEAPQLARRSRRRRWAETHDVSLIESIRDQTWSRCRGRCARLARLAAVYAAGGELSRRVVGQARSGHPARITGACDLVEEISARGFRA